MSSLDAELQEIDAQIAELSARREAIEARRAQYSTTSSPPEWLRIAVLAIHVDHPRYIHDRVELTLHHKQNPEWRIKCLDCPGKVNSFDVGRTVADVP